MRNTQQGWALQHQPTALPGLYRGRQQHCNAGGPRRPCRPTGYKSAASKNLVILQLVAKVRPTPGSRLSGRGLNRISVDSTHIAANSSERLLKKKPDQDNNCYC
ncbi:hypothetical protein TIFTF001_026940 [Ficus carica]|uniref:Transposase n=1 Tax=Ficus carica TaxID=3494 RepID=A0AA88IYV2_FICCA|nr:hypothetical protein TIFTF001_026940 [Ficus carica]